MKRHRTAVLFCLVFSLMAAAEAPASPQQNPTEARFDKARLAWDTGDFIPALEELEKILTGPEAARYVERIALLTGELFKVVEITPDGRSVRISPDGAFAAYETGQRAGTVTRIVSLDNPAKTWAEVRGTRFVFSPAPRTAAFLKVPESPELVKLRREIADLADQESPDRQTQMSKQRELAWLEAKTAQLVVFDVSSKREKTIKTDGLFKASPAWSPNGKEIYFVGARESDMAANEIYAIPVQGGDPRPLTSGAGFKIAPMPVPGGKYLLYAISPAPPFARPAPPAPDKTPATEAGQAAAPPAKPSVQAGGQAAGPPIGRGPGGRGGPQRQFALLNFADRNVWTFTGANPVVAADGSALVFVGRDGADNMLNYVKLGGEIAPVVLKKTPERIGSAAFSPDGKALVFDMTYTRNGEIFVLQTDAKGELRVSREIQPDRAPRFLASDLVLAIKGEPRHSRAHLYDLKKGSNLQVFRNNTLRTISPEYEWVANPAGTKLLIGAERDGDTISPERGLYLVDLTQRVGIDDLLARIRRNLTAEKALRAWGEKTFAPIQAEIRAAVDEVSITKIYEYEEALFGFDSKYITQPGNKKAADYIFGQLASFGYAPEYQEFESRGTKTANVLAWLRGTENPDVIYVLSGHFDSNAVSMGADDNSSVTAVNLETARLLAGKPRPYTIVFAFFTGEEAGLLGSREFVRVAREKGWRIAADINNDMIGWANDHRLDDTIRFANAGLRDIQHAAAFLFSKMVTYDTRYVRSTDGASFYEAYGDIVSGLGSYPVLGNPYYHQPTDLLETVNHQLLAEAAKYNLATIMMVASSPPPPAGLKIADLENDSAAASWDPSPGKSPATFLVEFGPEGRPAAHQTTVSEPGAKLVGFTLKKGETLRVAVRTIQDNGIASWDWSRANAIRK